MTEKILAILPLRALIPWLIAIIGSPEPTVAQKWALFDADCDRGTSSFEVTCGDYGTFHFRAITAPPDCTPIVRGELPLKHYSPPFSLPQFPQGPLPNEVTLAAGRPPSRGQNELDDLYLVGIDFDTVHGTSTSWTSGNIAGSEVTAELELLDDPSVEALGEAVGDQHVLAALCRIVERIDTDGRPAPLAVNMSFGRAQDNQDDPSSETCSPELVGCQVAKVITYLRTLGAEFVAAAGNHQQTLFPAVLDEVAATGALDLNLFFERQHAKSSWETPLRSDALMPASALCLRGGWAAAAGTSYSSAIFAGWIAELRVERPGLSPLDGGLWTPQWFEQQQCYALALDGAFRSRCNSKIDEIFAGLLGEYQTDCWESANQVVATVAPPGLPGPLPGHQSFDGWTAENHPTPEADPCVPCVGGPGFEFGGGDSTGFQLNMTKSPALSGGFQLNMTKSPALPSEIVLDSVYFRVDADFYRVDLPPSVLLDIEAGALDGLLFAGWGGVVTTERESSLIYILKSKPEDICNPGGPPDSDPCYWSSTPILWLPH